MGPGAGAGRPAAPAVSGKPTGPPPAHVAGRGTGRQGTGRRWSAAAGAGAAGAAASPASRREPPFSPPPPQAAPRTRRATAQNAPDRRMPRTVPTPGGYTNALIPVMARPT